MYIDASTIKPEEVLAGDSVQFELTLKAGADFKGKGDRIVLDMPAYLGYSRGSRLHQEMAGYINVIASNPSLDYIQRMWNMESQQFVEKNSSSFMGMAARIFVLDFTAGETREGDEIKIIFGQTLNGFGQGAKVTTIVPSPEFTDSFHVRIFSGGALTGEGLPDLGRSFKGYDRPVPSQEIPLSFRVLPREIERVRVIRHPDSTRFSLVDRFANPVRDDALAASLADGTIQNTGHNTYKTDSPDTVITPKEGLAANNAPRTDRIFGDYNLYFGDIHTHSGHSNDCIEREKNVHPPRESYAYARDVAALDFLAVTDHHQPWDIERNKIGSELWTNLVDQAREADEPGAFSAFAGLEYRSDRGDTAVVFAGYPDYRSLDNADLTEIDKWWEAMKGRDMITIPHFHNPGRLEDGAWIPSPEKTAVLPEGNYYQTEPVLEVFSCHGSYEYEGILEHRIPQIKASRPDRYGRWFLEQGYRYGFIANSDGHKGHPGSNGLTAVFARENTKEAIFDALRNRRCYGTTNARIKLVAALDGHLMGSELPYREGGRELTIETETEEPLKYVEVIVNSRRAAIFTPEGWEFKHAMTLKTEKPEAGRPVYAYVRVVQRDNGSAFSSPFFLV